MLQLAAALFNRSNDYRIERSLRFRSVASAYLSRTLGTPTNNKKWTWSGWVKRGTLSSGIHSLFQGQAASTSHSGLRFNANDTITLLEWTGSATINLNTTAVYRDPSAHYHITLSVDTTLATSTDRVRMYVNGNQATLSGTYPALNQACVLNTSGYFHAIGRFYDFSTTQYFDGLLSDVHFIDGQALDPSNFGETDTATGVWKPKAYTGTYGTNGFHLEFKDNSAATASAIGADTSGNGNNWTPANISLTANHTYDSMIDVPTPYADGGNGRGNYATLNVLNNGSDGTSAISFCGLYFYNNDATNRFAFSTIPIGSGKYYWEVTATFANPYGYLAAAQPQAGGTVGVRADGTLTGATGTAITYTAGDVLGIAADAVAGTLTIYKNGVLATTLTASSSLIGAFPSIGDGTAATAQVGGHINFGQRPFTYAPPEGFKTLCTHNLSDPLIKRPEQYFDALTYAGNGATQSITGLDFSSDLLWIKERSSTSSHVLMDSVRGEDWILSSNTTDADAGFAGAIDITPNGFDLLMGQGAVNQSLQSYIAWCWKESALAGFDIVSYTGTGANRTIAHNLGVAPSLIIVKNRSAVDGWAIYHKNQNATPQNGYLDFTTAAYVAAAGAWNNAAPSSTEFTVGTSSRVNGGGANYIAYLFAEIAGFSKFGSYTGNGSADGPFVWCGFKPRYVLCKRIDAVAQWTIHDTARSNSNLTDDVLYPNLSNAEEVATATAIDIVSNGFKVRHATGAYNASGGIYIYAAFADSNFKYALAR